MISVRGRVLFSVIWPIANSTNSKRNYAKSATWRMRTNVARLRLQPVQLFPIIVKRRFERHRFFIWTQDTMKAFHQTLSVNGGPRSGHRIRSITECCSTTALSETKSSATAKSTARPSCSVDTNRKPIWDFLLVINSNLPPVVHRFQLMADYWSNFR